MVFLAALSALAGAAHGQDADQPTATASEANPAVPAAGHSIHGESFNAGPRQAALLLPGQGEVSFPVTTTSAEAQAFVTQGVAQLHTFYYLEAERSFRQAAKLDPNCAMAYWGMAMANTNNAKRAKGFLKEASSKVAETKVSRREQLYIDALNAKYKEGGDAKGNRQGYLAGLEAIVQEFEDDLDARCWLAMVTWENSNSGDGIGSRQAVEELLRSVERVAPMHPGMHHYRIHLWDGKKPELAEKSAGLYASAAPGIAHAWHMPGHTYSGLKRYADAAYQQEGSARVDHAAMARDRVMPFEIHNYAHNNQWLATSLSHAGRPRLGIQVARNLVDQPRDPSKNNNRDGGSAQRSGRMRWVELLTRYELWPELIEATDSGALDWSDIPAERRERHYSLGLAYAWTGNHEAAREQVQALQELAPKQSQKKEGAPKEGEGDTATEESSVEAPKENDTNPAKTENKADASKEVATARDEKTEVSQTSGETNKDEAVKSAAASAADGPEGSKAVESAEEPAKGKGAGERRKGSIDTKAQIAEIEGLLLIFEGKPDEGVARLNDASAMRPEAKARALAKAGQIEAAVESIAKAAAATPTEVPPLACQVEILQAAGKFEEAQGVYARLAGLTDLSEEGVPVFERLRAITAGWATTGWAIPAQVSGSLETRRAALAGLGSLCWAPYRAEEVALHDTEGRSWGLSEHKGRNVILLFYLGGKCAHCMQQIEAFGKEFEALRAAGTDVVAISTDDVESTRALKHNDEGVRFPMPMLSDPGLGAFHAYRCFDDFEGAPLHGTFLIDGSGLVRFQNISFEPFMDVEFLKGESARVSRLNDRNRAGMHGNVPIGCGP